MHYGKEYLGSKGLHNPNMSIKVENHLNFTPCNQTPLPLNPIEKVPDDNEALECLVTYGSDALCSPGVFLDLDFNLALFE